MVFIPTKFKFMKKLRWAVLLLFAISLSIQCTNDEGENDIDVINPVEEEPTSEKKTKVIKKL